MWLTKRAAPRRVEIGAAIEIAAPKRVEIGVANEKSRPEAGGNRCDKLKNRVEDTDMGGEKVLLSLRTVSALTPDGLYRDEEVSV